MIEVPWSKFPLVAAHPHAHRWLQVYANVGRGYAGLAAWPILEGRYTLAVLFEYAATLGLVDVNSRRPRHPRPAQSQLTAMCDELWHRTGSSVRKCPRNRAVPTCSPRSMRVRGASAAAFTTLTLTTVVATPATADETRRRGRTALDGPARRGRVRLMRNVTVAFEAPSS